jgi:hypothetical protein
MAKSKEVAKTNMPASVAAYTEEYSGAGVSTAAEDNLIPMLRILQDGSPQVKSRDARHIPGAEPGMLACSQLNLLLDPEEEIRFQPCAFTQAYVEWIPRNAGGGFVASHTAMPDDAIEDENDKGQKIWRRGDNEVIHTRYHWGFLIAGDQALPMVIPFSSSGHTVSRGWMTVMNNQRINGKILPSFVKTYKLGTALKKNAEGDWFVIEVTDPQFIEDENQLQMGADLYKAIMAGEKDIIHDEDTTSTKESESF